MFNVMQLITSVSVVVELKAGQLFCPIMVNSAVDRPG